MDELEGKKYSAVVRWLKPRRDGYMWGGAEKTPYVDRYTFCGAVKYDKDSYTICLEWDEQHHEQITADVFPLVKWAPFDLIKPGKVLILYHGSDPVAEVRIGN